MSMNEYTHIQILFQEKYFYQVTLDEKAQRFDY